MEELFTGAGIALSRAQLDRFWAFHLLIEKHNDELDLTRIRRFDDIVIKHFIDCIHVTALCELAGPLVDIGTGAGFPGIPLKIVRPELEIILADTRSKRTDFLALVVAELGLEGVHIYPHKVTDLSFFEAGGVITRALESADETLSRVHHFLPRGGRVYLMKGNDAGDDLRAISAENRRRYATVMDRTYELPNTDHQRRLIVFEKIDSARTATYRILRDEDESVGTVVTSPDNKSFKEMKRLTAIEGIRKQRRLIVSGPRQVVEFSRSFPELAQGVVIGDGLVETDDEIMRLIRAHAESRTLWLLKKSLFNELDGFNTGRPLLVAALPDIPAWDGTLAPGCSLVLPFQDPVNAGSAIRSAAAFGVARIIVLKECAHPFHPRAVRSSGGAVFHAPLAAGPSLAEFAAIVRESRLPVVSLDAAGTPIGEFSFPESFLLVPGMEGPGLPDDLKRDAVSIPIARDVESLNAAVAASIALFAWKTRQGKA